MKNMIHVPEAEREATISYITLFHSADTCLNHSISVRCGVVSRLKEIQASCRGLLDDGCGRNMTKDLSADVIASLAGAQGRIAPRGKEKRDEKELKQPTGLFSFLLSVCSETIQPSGAFSSSQL